MSSLQATAFFDRAVTSGLVTASQLRSLCRRVSRGEVAPSSEPITLSLLSSPNDDDVTTTNSLTPDDFVLANAAVTLRYVSRWQAIQLLRGRTKFTLGHFRIVDSLGSGGYGQVFLGKNFDDDLSLGGPANEADRPWVAVKVLPMARARATPMLVTRFLHEIDVQRDIAHPHIARLLDSGHDANVHYMVHEYIGGCEVRQWMRRVQSLRYDHAAAVITPIARALHYLHTRGLIHRDVKPANILLTASGIPKLIDMGLLTRADNANDLEMTSEGEQQRHWDKLGLLGKIAGTVEYIAPDQIRCPNHPTAAWDVYALGCTLYQLMTGSVPFPEGTSHDKLFAHVNRTPVDPRVYNPSVPFDVAQLVLQMLAKSPLERVESCEEVASRLSVWASPIPPIPVINARRGDSSLAPPPVLS
ncbi:MAG: serine/threonine-protein kinase [Thermoguttaceae bacterium]